jgi:hypothetical protein
VIIGLARRVLWKEFFQYLKVLKKLFLLLFTIGDSLFTPVVFLGVFMDWAVLCRVVETSILIAAKSNVSGLG